MIRKKSIIAIMLLFSCGISTVMAQTLNLRLGNDTLNFKPSALFYMDGAAYIQDKTDLSNGVAVPEIRLGFQVNYGRWTATAVAGFGNNNLSVKDVHLRYTLTSRSYLFAGHYAEPYGVDIIESVTSTKFNTPNASSLAFSPGRGLGVGFLGWNKIFWLNGGVFSDGNAVKNSQEGDAGYAATARFAFNPLRNTGSVFHLGMAGSVRRANASGREEVNGVLKENPRSVSYKSSMLTNVEKLKPLEANIGDANYQAKYALEFIGALGPAFLQSEYYHTNVRRKNGLPTYQAQGVYAQVGFLLTGGGYEYSDFWAMLKKPNPGTLELVARVNYTDLDDAHSNIYGGTMRDCALGLNYYLNKFILFRASYTYIRIGDRNPALAGENIHAFQGRIQFLF